MRIVIDLQGVQSGFLSNTSQISLSLSLALVRNTGEHEFLLMLNGCFQDTIAPIRDAFSSILPVQNIRIWDADAPLAAQNPENAQRRDMAEYIREAVLASLYPDFVLLTNLFVGFNDDTVTSIGKLADLPTAVLLYNSTLSKTSGFTAWYKEKQKYLQCARLVFLASSRSDLSGIAPETTLDLSDLLDFPSSDKSNSFNTFPEAAFDRAARRILENLTHYINETPPLTSSVYRSRLAYVSPLPPERSGISSYSIELLPFLSRFYDIEIIVDQTEIHDEWVTQNCAIRNLEWFRTHADYFDRVLYHFGNSPFHQHMFALLKEIPGVVVLHDFFLSGVQAYRALQEPSLLWEEELYAGHGYRALCESHTDKNAAIMKYPVNLHILQMARGIIVHSVFSRQLACRYYGDDADRNWVTLPHLRVLAPNVDRNSARQALNLKSDHFLVCAFGMMGATKLNERLIDVWLTSPLAKDKRTMLIFVGESNHGDYGRLISRKILESGMGQRIRITGWVDSDTFQNYLMAADIGVQLRAQSRGETSGTVLDCMNYGLATIINAHGSLADVDPTGVWLLPDIFENRALSEALTTLWRDSIRRKLLGEKARAVISKYHTPEYCAERYTEAIECFYRKTIIGWFGILPLLSTFLRGLGKERRHALANVLARNFPPSPRKRQLLVDVSAMVETDLKTGIQRVVRAVLGEWLSYADADWRVEPVYAVSGKYRYACRFTCRLLNLPDRHVKDPLVDAWPGDVFFGLDFHNSAIPAHKEILMHWKNTGVKVGFLVHDLLPVTHPNYFPEGTERLHQNWLETISEFDLAVCVSSTTADALKVWLTNHGSQRNHPIRVEYSHNGADVVASTPTRGFPPNTKKQLHLLQSTPSFLMVGTLEPRKGHADVLEAFEHLWSQGMRINLVIVGKNGWMVNALANRVRTNAEYGRQLFWLEEISDEYLESIYAASTCLVAASHAEGFGLPLIEAAHHKLPIIARDIPVFREVAGDHATYFSGNLAQTLKNWLAAYHCGEHLRSDCMPWFSWQESAKTLWNLVTKDG